MQPEPAPYDPASYEEEPAPYDSIDWTADPDAYRRAAGRFATGVTIVTTHVDGIDHAMTVNAFTSVSLDPVRVLFCAEKKARFHESVLRSGLWAVSVLPRSARDTSSWFATRGRPLAGQVDRWHHDTGPRTGAPVFLDALAAMECRTAAVHDGGDHSIVLGDVLGVCTPNPDGQPLLYYEGGYAALYR